MHLCSLKQNFNCGVKGSAHPWDEKEQTAFLSNTVADSNEQPALSHKVAMLLHFITPWQVPVQCHVIVAPCTPSVSTALGVHGSVALSIGLLTAFHSPSCPN